MEVKTDAGHEDGQHCMCRSNCNKPAKGLDTIASQTRCVGGGRENVGGSEHCLAE